MENGENINFTKLRKFLSSLIKHKIPQVSHEKPEHVHHQKCLQFYLILKEGLDDNYKRLKHFSTNWHDKTILNTAHRWDYS